MHTSKTELMELIEAFEELDEYELWLLGFASEEKLQQKIEKRL